MEPYNKPVSEVFDVGFGPTIPDPEIMETGRVPASMANAPEQFEAEREIFRKVWLQVARREDVRDPGDWVVREVEIAGASIIIVHDKTDGIKAFHNVCQHRGMRLLWDERGHGPIITCPYHAWSYGTNGKLKVMPDQAAFSQLCKDKVALTPIHVDEWEGFLFINLDPHPAQTLKEFLGPLGKMLKDMDFAQFTTYARVTETVSANWKLGVDAGAEGYHIGVLHAKSAKPWACTEENPHVHYLGWESLGPHRLAPFPRNPDMKLAPAKPIQMFAYSHIPQLMIADTGGASGLAGKAFGDHPDLNRTKANNWGGDQIFLFPVGALNLTLNGLYHNCYWPLTPDTARWQAQWYFRYPRNRREQFGMECSMAQNRDIVTEDNFAVHGQHDGLKSGAIKEAVFGEGEMLPRHMAAVIKGIADKIHEQGREFRGG
jgi:phenylpropionate dioxygenase-like ring-hydroxylating dioxygenase large terminal subunit